MTRVGTGRVVTRLLVPTNAGTADQPSTGDNESAAGTIHVTVTPGYAVHHDGKQHSGGTTLDVDTLTARRWINRGWVTEAKPTTPAPRKRKSHTNTT